MSYRFALLLGSLMASFAFALPQAYITNEKDNTLSVIDMSPSLVIKILCLQISRNTFSLAVNKSPQFLRIQLIQGLIDLYWLR